MLSGKTVLTHKGVYLGVASLTLMLSATPAYALGGTLGDVLDNVTLSSAEIPYLLSGFSYLCGIILGFLGILKLKEHVLYPTQTPIWESIKKFIAGGAFFALPEVIDAVHDTMALDIDGADESGFNPGAVTGGGLDAMVVALMGDIWTPLFWLLSGFCYLAGLILVIVGISRLLKTAQEGPRGPTGLGTIFTFLVGGALLSMDSMMGAFMGSLFDGGIHNYAELAFDTGMAGDEVEHVHAVISAVLAFVAIVGWVSFIRGWFIIREVAEGSHQASLMAGLTHVFGGALAVNLGAVMSAVQETLGITDYGIIFS